MHSTRWGLVTQYLVWSVTVGHKRKPCKTAETIEMLISVWTQGGPRNHILCGGPDLQWEGAHLWVVLEQAQSCPWSTFSIILARQQQYRSNLLSTAVITVPALTKASATAASSSDWRWITELAAAKRSGLASRLLPWLWATRYVGTFDRMPSDEPGRCTAATSGGLWTRRLLLMADRCGDDDRLPAEATTQRLSY